MKTLTPKLLRMNSLTRTELGNASRKKRKKSYVLYGVRGRAFAFAGRKRSEKRDPPKIVSLFT